MNPPTFNADTNKLTMKIKLIPLRFNGLLDRAFIFNPKASAYKFLDREAISRTVSAARTCH
jgi:hypothetical protein